MKLIKFCLAIASIVAAVSLNSDSDESKQEAETVSFELKISNIEETEGKVIMGIFADEKAWKDLDATHSLEAEPSIKGSSATIELEPGEYAASAYQDLNDDGEFNRKGMMRLPGEPYGFSNNARPRFGVPGWKRVKFTVDENSTEHTIKLVQP